MKRHGLRWLTAGFAVFLVYIIVAADLGGLPAVFDFVYRLPGEDRLGHFLLIGTLALLLNLSFAAQRRRVSLGLLGLVTLEEFSQRHLIHRSFDWWDLAANVAGIAVAWAICQLWDNWRDRCRLGVVRPMAGEPPRLDG